LLIALFEFQSCTSKSHFDLDVVCWLLCFWLTLVLVRFFFFFFFFFTGFGFDFLILLRANVKFYLAYLVKISSFVCSFNRIGEGKSVANVCIGFLGLFLEWDFFFLDALVLAE
jgi:hypothetical protein